MSRVGPPPYEIEFYTEPSGEKPCLRWIREDLSPTKRRALGMAMNEVLQRHGVGVVGERSWGRQLGQGLFEFRVDRRVKPNDEIVERLSLRVFCHAHGDRKILALHGYDKSRSPGSKRQQREIAVARTRLSTWRTARAGHRPSSRSVRRAVAKPASQRRG